MARREIHRRGPVGTCAPPPAEDRYRNLHAGPHGPWRDRVHEECTALRWLSSPDRLQGEKSGSDGRDSRAAPAQGAAAESGDLAGAPGPGTTPPGKASRAGNLGRAVVIPRSARERHRWSLPSLAGLRSAIHEDLGNTRTWLYPLPSPDSSAAVPGDAQADCPIPGIALDLSLIHI